MNIIENAKRIKEEWNALTTDLQRLEYLKTNNTQVKAVLDNDLTMVAFMEPDGIQPEESEVLAELESDMKNFDNYHGWTDAVVELFGFAGINAESC